jgi:hypothetical protein
MRAGLTSGNRFARARASLEAPGPIGVGLEDGVRRGRAPDRGTSAAVAR